MLIGCAGMAACVASVIAGHTRLSVIGLPLSGGVVSGDDARKPIQQREAWARASASGRCARTTEKCARKRELSYMKPVSISTFHA